MKYKILKKINLRKIILLILFIPILLFAQINNINDLLPWDTADKLLDCIKTDLDSLTNMVYINSQRIDADTVFTTISYDTAIITERIYIISTDDTVFSAGTASNNNKVVIDSSGRIITIGALVVGSEVFMGNASTDTTEIYGITRFRQPIYFDSTGANRTIDLSAEDERSWSKYWLYMDNVQFLRRNGWFQINTVYALTSYYLAEPGFYKIGEGLNGSLANSGMLGYESADANANMVILTMPNGGAAKVPVFLFADSSYYRVSGGLNLGWFDGITDPSVAILSNLTDGAMRIAGQVGADSLAGFYSYGVNKGFHFYDDVKIDSTLRLAPIATPANPVEGEFFVTSTGDSMGVYLASGWKWFIGGE